MLNNGSFCTHCNDAKVLLQNTKYTFNNEMRFLWPAWYLSITASQKYLQYRPDPTWHKAVPEQSRGLLSGTAKAVPQRSQSSPTAVPEQSHSSPRAVPAVPAVPESSPSSPRKQSQWAGFINLMGGANSEMRFPINNGTIKGSWIFVEQYARNPYNAKVIYMYEQYPHRFEIIWNNIYWRKKAYTPT